MTRNWQKRIVVGLIAATLVWAAGAAAEAKSKTKKSDKKKPAATGPLITSDWKIEEGQFKPAWDSLAQYQCPDWFRDAKFGIWAHWSAQCVPEEGDWYARKMYMPTEVDKKTGKAKPGGDYAYHVAHYGHPSKVGFKDICNVWKAEKWEPEKLIALYKRVGAKYFVALANHHCNFDCWDSKYQPWNSVNIGPKKDIVGTWAAAARKEGLRFGVTVHCGRSWSWYEVAHGADKVGPLAGVPYDGVLTKADGKGTWWEGYDPQELYCRAHTPGERPDRAYCEKFFNRTKDLIDKYQPDLLYFDDGVLPLNATCDAGLSIAAHYYNASRKWHDGRNEAVMNTKGLNPEQRKCLVWDIERGRSDRIEAYPWQTDTCIGSWHYSRSIRDGHRYKTPATVITMLVDIVSKNGNLLLNVPVRGDGTIDEDEVQCLEGIAKWMAINSEAIFGTRPFAVFGEGAEEIKAGNFNEGKTKAYTAKDLRFTTKGTTLYATLFGWPEKQSVIESLGKAKSLYKHEIAEVRMLGVEKPLKFSHDDKALTVEMPEQKPCEHAYVLKITAK